MSLDTTATQSLVTAMARGVQEVELGVDLILDMETLAQYDGRGMCGEAKLRGKWYGGMRTKMYADKMKIWAKRMGWSFVKDDFNNFATRRSKKSCNII